jgi:hypothetical protein
MYKHLYDLWGGARTNWQDSDRYFHRTYDVWPDPVHAAERGKYRPSTPTSTINGASDQFLAYKLRIHREPLTESDQSFQEASELETALLAVMEDAFLKESQFPFKQAGKHLALYGYTNIHGPVLDSADLMEKPRRRQYDSDKDYSAALKTFQNERRHWNPIRIRAEHPARVLMPPLQKTPGVAIHVVQFEAQELHDLTVKKKKTRRGASVFPVGDNPLEIVTVQEFWTDKYHALKVKDKEMLYAEKNTWNYVPFGHGFAGLGVELSNMEEWDPRYLAEGMLDSIKDSIRNQAQFANAKTELVINKAYAIWGTNRDAAEFREMLSQGGIATGEQSDYWVLNYPNADRSLFEAGKEADDDIQLGSYQRTALGARPSGVSTVGQHAQMSSATQRKFTTMVVQLEHLATVVAQRVLRLCDLEGPFKVNGKVLHPSMIHNDYNVRATFEVRDPVMEMQMRQVGLQEFGMGLLDDVTYWEEYAREEDITKRMDRMLQMFIRRLPSVHEAMAEETAEGMGVGDIVKAANELRKTISQNGSVNGASNVPISEDIMQSPLGEPFANGTNLASEPRLRQPISEDTPKPKRIDLGR